MRVTNTECGGRLTRVRDEAGFGRGAEPLFSEDLQKSPRKKDSDERDRRKKEKRRGTENDKDTGDDAQFNL